MPAHTKFPSMTAAALVALLLAVSSALSQGLARDTAPLDLDVGRRRAFNIGSTFTTSFSFSQLFRELQLPYGFEGIDSAIEPYVTDRPTTQVVTTGLTLRALLDAVVGADPRYEWHVIAGVVVMRPVEAWRNPGHPLHRAVPAVTLANVHLDEAVSALFSATGQSGRPSGVSGDDRDFSLQFAGGSLLELLSAVSRAHGTLGWSLEGGPLSALQRGRSIAHLQLRAGTRQVRLPNGPMATQSLGATIDRVLVPGPAVTEPVVVRGAPRVERGPAGASVAGSGAIVGRVVDRSGAELPGVKVAITGPGVDTTVVTDGQGEFDARAQFQAADYELTFTLPGFAAVRRTIRAIPFGLVNGSLTLRVCDIGDRSTVDLGVAESIRITDAIVHLRIDAVEPPRSAQEAGEGTCGGQERWVAIRPLATGKLAPRRPVPSGFVVRGVSRAVDYRAGEEYLAFLAWRPELATFVPGAYAIPVVDGRIVWRRQDQSVLKDGMPIGDAMKVLTRLARRVPRQAKD